MTKEQFHEEELKILRRKSKTQNIIGGISSSAIILILIGALLNFNTKITDRLTNHENRITVEETISKRFLNDTDGEFIARRVGGEIENRINKKLENKVDKTAFDILLEDIKYIKNKVDD